MKQYLFRLKLYWTNIISLWEYGTCNNKPARRHKINKNVQFVIWKKGDQKYVDGIGHTEDKWIDFDKSWWSEFVPNKNVKQ